MTWCPFTLRMELNPESYQQMTITPTQFIMHSIAAPWDERRMYEYWRDSTNLESTWGLDFDGSCAQYLSTTTRADANNKANVRAVSIETASNLEHTDAWTPAQMEMLIRIGVWLHHEHGIPLRKCRTWDDPGYGYHRMFPEWSVSGTDCPGDARAKQFNEYVFPEIVRRASGAPTPPAVVEDEGMGPIMLMPGLTGDASAVTIPVDMGPGRVMVSTNYVEGTVKLRLDAFYPNGSAQKFNVVWDFVNCQWGYLDVEGPCTVVVQRLTDPHAHVSVAVVKR